MTRLLPKVQKKEVNYFQPEQVAAIREALEREPLKWKTLVHMFLITGARRGEVLGLKWDKVDFEENRVHICNNVLYSAERGIYEDTPKTSTSDRFITLPAETMQLLRQYRVWQNGERLRLGHAPVSTTANIYAHVTAEADQKNADILADVFLKKA